MIGALTRYRVMAVIVGVTLAIIVFIGVPLQIAGDGGLAYWLGFAHGWILYPLYLLAALDLFRRSWVAGRRLGGWHLLAMVCAGFVPILAFIVERWITSVVRRDLAEGGEVTVA